MELGSMRYNPRDFKVGDVVSGYMFDRQDEHPFDWDEEPERYVIDSYEERLGERFVTLVPLNPIRRDKPITVTEKHLCEWTFDHASMVTSPLFFERGKEYRAVIQDWYFKVIAIEETGVKLKTIGGGTKPESFSWEFVCSRSVTQILTALAGVKDDFQLIIQLAAYMLKVLAIPTMLFQSCFC